MIFRAHWGGWTARRGVDFSHAQEGGLSRPATARGRCLMRRLRARWECGRRKAESGNEATASPVCRALRGMFFVPVSAFRLPHSEFVMIGKLLRGVAQAVLVTLGGGLTAQGLLTEDQLQQGIGAVLTLVALGWVAWQNKRKRTVPGGEFNPRAEVRAALPGDDGLAQRRRDAEGESGRRRLRLPWGRRGAARLPALAAMGIWLVGCAAIGLGIESCRTWRVERTEVFPDVTETPDLSRWIATQEVADERGFLVRLMVSLRPSVRVERTKGTKGTERTEGTKGVAVVPYLMGGAEF